MKTLLILIGLLISFAGILVQFSALGEPCMCQFARSTDAIALIAGACGYYVGVVIIFLVRGAK